MGRGGLGARKSLEEKFARSTRYHLIGVKAGSPVAEVNNVLRRWDLGYRKGVILRNSGHMVIVQWEGEDEFSHYSGEDARYKVDTNMWRIGQPPQASPLTALTSGGTGNSIMPSPPGDSPLTKENEAMSTKLTAADINKMMLPALRTLAKKHFEPEDLKGLKKADLQNILIENLDSINESDGVDDDIEEEDDEVYEDIDEADSPDEADDEDEDELEDDEPAPKTVKVDKEKVKREVEATVNKAAETINAKERETYTAKQVATRIGTDAKTLRKFFRSPASNFEPVGQGGRYEFDAADLPAIKEAFTKWNEGKAQRTTKKRETPAEPKRAAAVEEIDEDELELDDDPEANFEEEPTDDELAELTEDLDEDDDIELDDEED